MKNKNELFGLVGQRLIINQKLVKNINYEKESYKLRCQDQITTRQCSVIRSIMSH